MGQFYSSEPEQVLRLGDIVTGFPVTTPQLDTLASDLDKRGSLMIEVSSPKYLVVMTPCCSIEEGCVILAPLSKVRPAFLKNPYFEDELSRLNRRVNPRDSIPPKAWGGLTEEARLARLAEAPGYVFLDCFVYAPHDFLPEYNLKQGSWETSTGHYMVDFKTVYRFESKMINRNAPLPAGHKLLQLTVDTRTDLRNKLTHFFSRMAEEDRREMQAQ